MYEDKMTLDAINEEASETGADKQEITVKRLNFKLNDYKNIIAELVKCLTRDQEYIFEKR